MERLPNVNDSDDYLRAWSMLNNHRNLLEHRIELAGAVTPHQPDVAVVHWSERGHPVTREVSLRMPA